MIIHNMFDHHHKHFHLNYSFLLLYFILIKYSPGHGIDLYSFPLIVKMELIEIKMDKIQIINEAIECDQKNLNEEIQNDDQ